MRRCIEDYDLLIQGMFHYLKHIRPWNLISNGVSVV